MGSRTVPKSGAQGSQSQLWAPAPSRKVEPKEAKVSYGLPHRPEKRIPNKPKSVMGSRIAPKRVIPNKSVT